MGIKLELVDNDYVVRAKTDLAMNGTDDLLKEFLKNINDELLPGETAYLNIDGPDMEPVKFEISYSE